MQNEGNFSCKPEKYYNKIIFEQSEKIHLINDNFAFCILHFEFTNYRFRPQELLP